MFPDDCTFTRQSCGRPVSIRKCSLTSYYQGGGCAGRIMETNVLLLYLVSELLLMNYFKNIQNKTIYLEMKNCISS